MPKIEASVSETRYDSKPHPSLPPIERLEYLLIEANEIMKRITLDPHGELENKKSVFRLTQSERIIYLVCDLIKQMSDATKRSIK